MTGTWDAKRDLDDYRARRGEFRVVEVPPRRYLMADGHGDPDTAASYGQAVASLYPAAHRLKFASRRAGNDHVVPPLEGLWWADDLTSFTTARDKTRWSWTLMILVPDHVEDALLDRVDLGPVRVGTLSEGTCVQTLHVGPYDDEAPVLARLHDEVLPDRGLRPTGHHHELYLSDPRRTDPSRLRTVLRQPVAPA